ncbi:MAG TPA: MOSC domain-containing protein [Xanthomonadales bacterium]|nr:MOSC domain-containing protein [Xanthomonadales bacterium]
MKIISVNVAKPRVVEYQGRKVRSSIWKEPVSGRLAVSETNIDGDRQATAVIHGGIHKAVYAYSHDHYAWWASELQRQDLTPGMFGENLTISGLDESVSRIGDQWKFGDIRLVITGPRIPCSNLAMKFNDKTLPRRFSESGRPGVYLRVLETGSLAAGDSVEQIESSDGVTVAALYGAYTRPIDPAAQAVLAEALNSPFLDPDMAEGIRKRLKT